MTQFDERERAFEKKFGIDEEFQFKVAVRTARLFGLWAASQMQMEGSDAEAYAAQIGEIAISKPGHDELMRRIEQDFAAKGVNFTRHRLEKEINEFENLAQSRARSLGH